MRRSQQVYVAVQQQRFVQRSAIASGVVIPRRPDEACSAVLEVLPLHPHARTSVSFIHEHKEAFIFLGECMWCYYCSPFFFFFFADSRSVLLQTMSRILSPSLKMRFPLLLVVVWFFSRSPSRWPPRSQSAMSRYRATATAAPKAPFSIYRSVSASEN